ncbi:hypothetical protein [Nostoc sp.]
MSSYEDIRILTYMIGSFGITCVSIWRSHSRQLLQNRRSHLILS